MRKKLIQTIVSIAISNFIFARSVFALTEEKNLDSNIYSMVTTTQTNTANGLVEKTKKITQKEKGEIYEITFMKDVALNEYQIKMIMELLLGVLHSKEKNTTTNKVNYGFVNKVHVAETEDGKKIVKINVLTGKDNKSWFDKYLHNSTAKENIAEEIKKFLNEIILKKLNSEDINKFKEEMIAKIQDDIDKKINIERKKANFENNNIFSLLSLGLYDEIFNGFVNSEDFRVTGEVKELSYKEKIEKLEEMKKNLKDSFNKEEVKKMIDGIERIKKVGEFESSGVHLQQVVE